MPEPILHLFCGKVAAGKSTLAAELAAAPGTVLISEDRWLSSLYRDEMQSVADYVRCSDRLASAMFEHVTELLMEGVSVVLDFPANTVAQRQRLGEIHERAGAAHQLHFLDVPDNVCKARLRERNALAQHEFAVSEAEFDRISSYFEPPNPGEGFNIVRVPYTG